MTAIAEEPIRIGQVLDGWLRRQQMTEEVLRFTLIERWPLVVGELLAARTRPGTLRQGRLTVIVANSSWLSDLRFMRPQILQMVNQVLGQELVTSLVLRVGHIPPVKPRSPRLRPRPEPPVVVPPERERDVERIVGRLGDKELGRAIRSAWLSQVRHELRASNLARGSQTGGALRGSPALKPSTEPRPGLDAGPPRRRPRTRSR